MHPFPTELFISMRWLDALDIFIVAILLFQLYQLIKGTAAIRIFVGILTIIIFWRLTKVFQMELVSTILGQFIGIGAIAVIIIFQPELRKFLVRIGSNSNKIFTDNLSSKGMFKWRFNEETETFKVEELSKACRRLAINKTGALIVIQKRTDLGSYIESGRKLDASLSTDLLESIFFKNSPLHDGAVIIDGNKILAASCILPVSDNNNIPLHYGLRHRAALGLSEISDCISIVVSEETGSISLLNNGKFIPIDEKDNLADKLSTII